MKNFLPLATKLDVIPLLHAIQRQPHLWNQHRLRTATPGSPHVEASDIWLRYNEILLGKEAESLSKRECINYSALNSLPEARQLIFGLMSRFSAERLGRCVITKLPPGGSILPHVDDPAQTSYYNRYHFALQAYPGSLFYCGDEKVFMGPCELWWFDNSIEHWVENESEEDRIHLIVDIKNSNYA